ncbi:Hypothetical protein, putative [Bodo saltans]|uniref:C3H1-type domain-containing protein n=1 Tax=Bodo saltans TaxID=75058 RepID=A0A0S4IT77_BODSA|nr:Hypothetical protein, putative [Bodo saltans]|eukprot:CUF39474.1 Hypothetical protein, putative [Bodo saltans]
MSSPAVETVSNAHHAVRLTKAERRRMTVDVYDADYTAVFLGVPRDRVSHLPQREKADRGKPLLQCGVFQSTSSCPQADSCPHVHADLTGLQPQHIHVNYAWKSVQDIPYECMCQDSHDNTFEVFAPNNRPPVKLVERQAILTTRGSLAAVAGQELSQCAHFYFNRMCNRGKNCLYIHVAHIDPEAADKQLAPTPDAIGPGVDEHPSSQKEELSTPCTPALSRVQSSVASPCCRYQAATGFSPSNAVAPLSPALSASLKIRGSPDDSFRPASVLSLPVSSAAPSAPSSGQYNDADISAILAQYPSDLDTLAVSTHSSATTPKAGPKCLEKLDLVRGRVVYYERDTMTPSQFRHNPYAQW